MSKVSSLSLPPIALWRRLLGKPLVWAAACALLALPWYLAGSGLELLPYLLTLVGGWLCGFAFVNATLGMQPPRRGALVHLTGAVLLGAALTWIILEGKDVVSVAPESVRAVILFLQMAAIPAAGWLWLALIGRVSDIARTPSARAQPAPAAPDWEEDYAGTLVRFAAIPMQMRRLGTIVAGVVVVVGSLAVLMLIEFDWFLNFGSARIIILAVGLLFALPAYLLLKSALGRMTVSYTVQFTRDQLRIDTDTDSIEIALRDIDELVWRCTSDYARLNVRGTGRNVSLIAGFARMPRGVLPQLPPLPHRILRNLTEAGLEVRRTRRPGLTVFRRPRTSAEPR